MKNNGLFALLASAFLVVLFFSYSNHFNNSFHFDDSHVIENNSSIKSFDIVKYFTDTSTFSVLPANQTYRPLFTTILALEYLAGGGKPLWFHIGTFSCYVLLGVLLFFLFRQIVTIARPGKDYSIVALMAAGFYLLHTANAETVNYVSAGSDLISTMLMVGALVIYALWPTMRKYGFYIIPLAMAMFTKEISAVFPLFLLIYLFIERKYATNNKAQYSHLLFTLIPTSLVCLAFLVLSSKMIPNTFTPSLHSRLEYILAQPFVIVHYFNSFILPFNLSADTDWGTVKNLFDDRLLIGFGFIVLLISLAVWAFKTRERSPIGFGICWFLIGVFPTSSGVVILSEVMNDHRMFLPFIGLSIAAAWTLVLLAQKYADSIKHFFFRKAALGGALIAILAAHAHGTFQRNKVWKNEESLWYDVTQKSPKNGRGLMNYGLTLMGKGRHQEALDYFERALAFVPTYAHLHINIAIAQDALGNKTKAEENFIKAMRFNPNYFGCYYFYARFLDKYSRQNEAIPLLTKAIDLSPNYLESRYLLMKISDKMQDSTRLRQIADNILKLWPNDTTARSYLEKAQNIQKMANSTEQN